LTNGQAKASPLSVADKFRSPPAAIELILKPFLAKYSTLEGTWTS
jgi:hypothetical protein